MSWAWEKGRVVRFFLIALLSWHALEAAKIYPDYLAYFNELIGGPNNGYKYLRDSNIDWGQDLKGLSELVKKEHYSEVALSYYGSADPAYYGIRTRALESDEFERPRPNVYALAVHHIDSVKWSSEYKPDRIIGHSIFVYDFSKPKERIR